MLESLAMKLNSGGGGLRMDGQHDLDDAETLQGSIFLETDADIERLDKSELVENDNLPFCPDGFFWGQQFQESMKEYKELDLKFCKQALKWLDEGKKVWYDCSW